MNKMQFLETTKERYNEHVFSYQEKHGGRKDIQRVETDPWYQVKVYHNPTISDIGLLLRVYGTSLRINRA